MTVLNDLPTPQARRSPRDLIWPAIAAACACAGMIVGTTSMTGLGVKMAMLIEYLAGGQLIIALLLTPWPLWSWAWRFRLRPTTSSRLRWRLLP